VFSSVASWKTLLDYFFVVLEPGEYEPIIVYLVLLQSSFMSLCTGMNCLDVLTGEGSGHVTNSVNVADGQRLSTGIVEGELILCKVFVGLATEVKTNKK